jgi:predicted enzyme related to lactoylglutathione lyase
LRYYRRAGRAAHLEAVRQQQEVPPKGGITVDVRRIVPDLSAADFEACKAFYGGVLGLNLAMDLEWVMTFVSAKNPTAQITMIRKDKTAPVNPQVSIEVDDATSLFDKAKAAGADIVYPLTDEPWGVRRFFVRDPNGVVLNIMNHIPPPNRGRGKAAA